MAKIAELNNEKNVPSDDDIAAVCKSLGWDLDAQEAADMILLVREVQSRYSSGLPIDDRAAYESGRRVGLDFAHSVVSEILRKHYYGSGISGLNNLIQQAADAIVREKGNPTTAITDAGQPAAPDGFALVPLRLTQTMRDVTAIIQAAQLAPGESIVEVEHRVRALLSRYGQPAASVEPTDEMAATLLNELGGYVNYSSAKRAIKAVMRCAAPVAQEPANPTLPYEQALSELIDRIVPGLDTGDILADAQQASAALGFAAQAQEPECSHCGGTGDVSGEYPGVSCHKCSGTGKSDAPVVQEFNANFADVSPLPRN